MRPFEVILIGLNLLALFLCPRNLSKLAGLSILAANLLALFIHWEFEGLRYQMGLSYVFVFLLQVLCYLLSAMGCPMRVLGIDPGTHRCAMLFILGGLFPGVCDPPAKFYERVREWPWATPSPSSRWGQFPIFTGVHR